MQPAFFLCFFLTIATAQIASADDPKFYEREKFTIVYQQTGAESGTITEHVRDWGRKRAELTQTETNAAGMKIKRQTHGLFEGAQVTTLDQQTGQVTTMTNPMYENIAARVAASSGTDVGMRFMEAMGGKKTAETGKFAGHSCEYWQLPMMNSKTCVTEWGGTLHMQAGMTGFSMDKKAVEVKLDDGGPDSAFAIDKSKAVDKTKALEMLKKI